MVFGALSPEETAIDHHAKARPKAENTQHKEDVAGAKRLAWPGDVAFAGSDDHRRLLGSPACFGHNPGDDSLNLVDIRLDLGRIWIYL